MYGEDGDDSLTGSGYLNGGSGNDLLQGETAADLLYGREGNDTINGGGGNDTIEDYWGSNLINAGAGDDRIVVYSFTTTDVNTATGGAGRDTYVLLDVPARLVVTDFAAGADGDIIDISNLLVRSSGYSSGNPFGSQGYLRLVQDGADTVVQWTATALRPPAMAGRNRSGCRI